MKARIFITLAFVSALVWSHGGGHPTRYVAVEGKDSGECATPETACASINFAVDKSNKGDKILVASGAYIADELDVFYLLSAMVQITGGYAVDDGFKRVDAEKNITTIVGIPFEYRDKLAKRGFTLLQDEKAIESGLSKNEKTWLQSYSKLTTQSLPAQECINGMADENPCHNIDRLAHMPLSQFSGRPTSASDIWGFVDLNNQREYALIGLSNGTSVVDVTAPSQPVEIAHINAAVSTWRDIKVYQYFDDTAQRYLAYAYVTSEAVQGMQVLDLSNLPNSVALVATLNADFVKAHNVYLANVDYASGRALDGFQPYLYVTGSNRSNGVFLTYDLSNPVNPTRVSEGSAGYVHDATTLIIDDVRTSDCAPGHNPCELLVDFNENTVDIWDVTNKASPLQISSTSYNRVGYVHSGWWSSDKQTLFVQDELDERDFGLNTTMRAMNISDLKNPRIVGVYTGPTQAIDHNGFTLGDYYYMSNYRRGLTVIDVSDPTAMQEVGFFDTFAVPAANSASFNGAWGTYPYLPSGSLLVSDIEYGLWVLKLNENDGEFSVPSPEPAPSQMPLPAVKNGGGPMPISVLCLLLLITASCRVRRH